MARTRLPSAHARISRCHSIIESSTAPMRTSSWPSSSRASNRSPRLASSKAPMARALSVHRTLVTPGERERFLERMARKQEHYTRAKCHFWLFEEASLPGAFLEFVEAPDEDTL